MYFESFTALCFLFLLTMKNFRMWCFKFVLCLQVFSTVSGLTVMEKIREDGDLSEVRFCFRVLQRSSKIKVALPGKLEILSNRRSRFHFQTLITIISLDKSTRSVM